MASSINATLDAPEVDILFLGDAGVGKSTFLSRLTLGSKHAPGTPLPLLRDLDQPFDFNISMYRRPYKFHFYDTASPENYTLLRPHFIVLCYDISRRETLISCQKKWKATIEGHFNYNEDIPVMLVGFKRDLRKEGPIVTTATQYQGPRTTGASWLGGFEGAEGSLDAPPSYDVATASVMPQEGYRVAQEMRLDRYAECSALTGELCREVIEDIARTAAMTTTSKGGRSEGTQCLVM